VVLEQASRRAECSDPTDRAASEGGCREQLVQHHPNEYTSGRSRSRRPHELGSRTPALEDAIQLVSSGLFVL